MSVAVFPSGKGVVTVAGTAKRRQSYVVRLITEKKEWYLGEFWDRVPGPLVSPDGRRLIISGGVLAGSGVFVLKLDADGTPEMADRPEKVPPPGGGDGMKVPLWRALPVGEKAADGTVTALACSADGKRVFTSGSGGVVQVFDPETLKLRAILWAAKPEKDTPMEWVLRTPEGAYVGSPAQEKIYAATGDHTRDPAKVKEALGMK
jgi:hypothetical protein